MALFDCLTHRQQKVYEFIRDKIRGRGYGPTVREIADQFDISSPNGVVCHLKALEKKGFITREPNMSRAIQLLGRADRRARPAPGRPHRRRRAARGHRAGRAGRFPGNVQPGTKNLFVLQVSGESMIEDQIADGDYVVVQKQRTARKGQIVVAIDRRRRSHAEALVPRKEPHPPRSRPTRR